MARGGGRKGTPGLRQSLRTVNAMGRQMGRERRGDFEVAQSALSAGQANLTRQQGRSERALALTNRIVNRNLTRLTDRAREVQRDVRRTEAGIGKKYGTGLSEYAHTVFGPARVGARTAGRMQERLMNQGSVATRIGQDTAAIAREGAAAQGAAADYMLSQALQQRTIIDNQTLAGLTGQLYQSALDYNMQWRNQKRQMDYATKLAEKEQGIDKADVATLGEVAPTLAAQAWSALDQAKQEQCADLPEGEQCVINISQAAEQAMGQLGIVDPNEQAIFLETMKGINAGMGMGDAGRAAVQKLYGGLPGYAKWGPAIEEAVKSGTFTAFKQMQGMDTLTPDEAQSQTVSDTAAIASMTAGGALLGGPVGAAGGFVVGSLLAAFGDDEKLEMVKRLNELQKEYEAATTEKERKRIQNEVRALVKEQS